MYRLTKELVVLPIKGVVLKREIISRSIDSEKMIKLFAFYVLL